MAVKALTPRELAVLAGIARDLTYVQIAFELDLGFESVKTYAKRLRAKTGARTKTGLALLASKNLKEGRPYVEPALRPR